MTCSAAQAELRDVALLQETGRTQLWLSFDAQPEAVSILPGEALVLTVDGVPSEAPRQIEPAVRGPVSALTLTPASDGVSISITGAFSGGEAEVRQGGVLVTLLNVTGVSAPIRRAPPRTPVAEQTPAAPPAQAAQAEVSAGSPDHDASDHADESSEMPAQESSSGDPVALSEDGVMDESVCPDSAARLSDAPWDLNLLSTHADCLVSVGDSEGAVALYQRVLAFDPRHFQAALGLARILSDQGDHQAAAELFDTAASVARTDGQAVQARMAARRARELAGSGGQ